MKKLFLPVIMFALGAGVVWAIGKSSAAGKPGPQAMLLQKGCEEKFGLINPWLRCEPEQNLAKKKEFSDFKQSLIGHINAWKSQGKISHASVYVRDLEFGPWMGIEEEEIYSAASLLKVPVMIAVLRLAQENPSVLAQRVEITPEIMSMFNQEFPPERAIEAGKVYTVDELLEFMIVYSDNNAANALHSYLQIVSPNEPLFLITMEEMGLFGESREVEDGITVKQSASMFRHLYNASFLSKEYSEKALQLLERSVFDSGIIAGLPADIKVAHKFGEREFEDGMKQLHDCGIVYHPGSNYLLCVMLRGKNIRTLGDVIGDVSELIDHEISEREKEGVI